MTIKKRILLFFLILAIVSMPLLSLAEQEKGKDTKQLFTLLGEVERIILIYKKAYYSELHPYQYDTDYKWEIFEKEKGLSLYKFKNDMKEYIDEAIDLIKSLKRTPNSMYISLGVYYCLERIEDTASTINDMFTLRKEHKHKARERELALCELMVEILQDHNYFSDYFHNHLKDLAIAKDRGVELYSIER